MADACERVIAIVDGTQVAPERAAHVRPGRLRERDRHRRDRPGGPSASVARARRRGGHRRGRADGARRRRYARSTCGAIRRRRRERLVTTMAAVDIGAQSGRVVVGRLDGERLAIEEVHRFPNVPVHAAGACTGTSCSCTSRCSRASPRPPASRRDRFGRHRHMGRRLRPARQRRHAARQNPVHHRDRRTEGVMDRVFADGAGARALRAHGDPAAADQHDLPARRSGRCRRRAPSKRRTGSCSSPTCSTSGSAAWRVCERTNASTTQCLDPHTGTWATDLLERLGIPAAPFREIVEPATVLGRLRDEVAERTGLGDTRVAVPGTHDTASAVAAVPFRDPGAAYISAGSWSLVGVELAEPLITDEGFAANLTNEGGVGGTTRLLRKRRRSLAAARMPQHWAAEGRDVDVPGAHRRRRGCAAAAVVHRSRTIRGSSRPAISRPRSRRSAWRPASLSRQARGRSPAAFSRASH